MNRHSSTPQHEPVVHGGTDAQGAPQWDFSTNNNAAGPCPATQAALAAADAHRYPNPSYTQLRNALATFHGVDGARILIGASGSELITRITCATALRCNQPGLVWLPPHAYAIASANVAPQKIHQLEALAPSWPIGAHGEALLHSWCQAATQAWLQQARQTLQQWKRQQLAWLNRLGWACMPSETHFWVARPHLPAAYNDVPQLLAYLRKHHIKLRDCASFGLPGHVRLCAHTPPAQQALEQALRQLT